MPILPEWIRYQWKNYYESGKLGKIIKIHGQDGPGGMCALAAAKSILKFNGISISQKEIGGLAQYKKNIGTSNYNLALVMNNLLKFHDKKLRFLHVSLGDSLYVSEASLKNLENYVSDRLTEMRQPIILGIHGIVPNKKNLYGESLHSHDVLLVDIKIDKENPYKTKYSIGDSNTPTITTEFTARDLLNLNIGRAFELIIPFDSKEFNRIIPQTRDKLKIVAESIEARITKTNTIYDEEQRKVFKELNILTKERYKFLKNILKDLKNRRISLANFNDFKEYAYDSASLDLHILIEDYIDEIRINSPELQYLLNKKINQEESNYEYLLNLEENKFVSSSVLMDTKFLVDYFKKIDEKWDPENWKMVLDDDFDVYSTRMPNFDDEERSEFYLQNKDKIDELVENFDFKKTSIPLTNKKIFFKFAKDSAVNYGKQLAFVSFMQFLLEDINEKSIEDVEKEFGKIAEQVAITEAIEGTINFSSSAIAKSLFYHTIVGAIANGIASGIITAEEGKDAREITNSIIASGTGTLAYIATTAGVTMVVAGPVGEVVAIPVALLVSTFASIGVEKALNSLEGNSKFNIPDPFINQWEESIDFFEYIYDIKKLGTKELEKKINDILYINYQRITDKIISKNTYRINVHNIPREPSWYTPGRNKNKIRVLKNLVTDQIRMVNIEIRHSFSLIKNIINEPLSSEQKSIDYNEYSNILNSFIEKFSLNVKDKKIKKMFDYTIKQIHTLLALFQNFVLTDKLLESYVIELENHKSVDWEINLHNIVLFLTKEIKKYEPNLINLDPIYKIDYLKRFNNLDKDYKNINSTLEKEQKSLIVSSAIEKFYMKNTKTIMLLKFLGKETLTRENYIKNLDLFNEILKQENDIDFSDNLNLFNNISTQFNTKFHSDILDLRARLNRYNLSSPKQKKTTGTFFELAESLYNDIKNNVDTLIFYKKISQYVNLIINISKNLDKNFEEEKEVLENKLAVFYTNELTDDYDYINKIWSSLSKLQNSEKEPEKFEEKNFIIDNYLHELEFLYDKKEKLIKAYNFSGFTNLSSLNRDGLMELFIINNLILNTKDIINNFVNFFHHDENLDKSINKNLKIEQEKRTLLVEQLNLINNKDDKSKDRIDYLNSVLDSYSYLENQVEDSKESEYHKNTIKEFWKNEEIYDTATEIINNNFNNWIFLQTKQQSLVPFVLSKFLDWLDDKKDNPEIKGTVNIIKRNIERKMVFYTALETLKLNLFNKGFNYQSIINKLDINDNNKESLKQLYKNIQELEEHDNINSKNTTQNEPDTTTFKPDSFLTESPDHIKKELEINIDNKKEELYSEWEKAITEIIDNYYLDLREINYWISVDSLGRDIIKTNEIRGLATIFEKQEKKFFNKIQSYVNKKNLSTSGLEILSYKVLDEPKLGQLAYKNSNFQEIPLNQTNGNDSSFDWPKIKNTAVNYGWTIAGTVTLAGFGYGLYRWWRTGEPENVINPIKNEAKQSVSEQEQLILKTINIEQREETELTALEKDLLQASTIDIEEELKEEWETTV